MDSQFLFLFRGGDPARAGFSPHMAMQQWGAWVAEHEGQGRFVHGEPLPGPEGCVLAPEGAMRTGAVGSPADVRDQWPQLKGRRCEVRPGQRW